MNRLLTRPPVSVTIGGVEYPINTNFRNCILSASALEDAGLSEWEKADILLHNHYRKPYPEDINAAVEQILHYLTQNRDPDKEEKPRHKDLCFEQDSQMIYDAFLSKGINLDEREMSFWEFMSHLRELPKDCLLCRVVYLRVQNRRGKLSKDEKAECGRIGWDVINLRNKKEDQIGKQIEAEIAAYYESIPKESEQ